MARDIDALLRPVAERLLAPGETMNGYVIATEQKTFSGHPVLLVVTDQRLILQVCDRHWAPKGEPTSIRPGELASAKEVDRWWTGATVSGMVARSATEALRFETASGEKHKLMMMKGTGILGEAGGGQVQEQSIAALMAWLQANSPS